MRPNEQNFPFNLIVLSDVHILRPGDHRFVLMLELLQKIDGGSLEYLVLLGDIFDFCFGHPYFEKKYEKIGAELSRIASLGTKVIFVQGNHEFAIQKLRWPGVEFVTAIDRSFKLADGVKVTISHGDFFAAPWHYHLYCRIVRSSGFHRLVSLLPMSLIDYLCLKVSARSRLSSSKRRIPHRRILNGARAWLANKDCDYGIMGHYHVPYYYRLPKQNTHLLCLPSWDQPNLLGYANGEFKRVFFS